MLSLEDSGRLSLQEECSGILSLGGEWWGMFSFEYKCSGRFSFEEVCSVRLSLGGERWSGKLYLEDFGSEMSFPRGTELESAPSCPRV